MSFNMRYFPLTDDDSKPQLHLKSVDLKDWIEIDEQFDTHLALKREILKNHRATALKVLPAADEAAIELNEILKQHLLEHFADHYLSKKIDLRRMPSPSSGEAALEQISTLVQEDFALMTPAPPVNLAAGLICFPSRWSLIEKISLDSNGIHGPVPRFQSVARQAQTFLERIAVDKPMWRINWTIHDSDELFCPRPVAAAQDLTSANILSRTWLRVERQTLRRLPQTKFVAFSIRTYVTPMSEVIADPIRLKTLNQTLEKLHPETAAYKGMGTYHPQLKEACLAVALRS